MKRSPVLGVAARSARGAEPQRGRSVCRNRLGRLVGLDRQGRALVQVDGEEGSRTADTTVALRPGLLGSRVVLLSGEGGELIVTGVVRAPGAPELAAAEDPPAEVVLDGERLVLSAAREVVLRCGKASITLREDGKVVVRGADVLQVSSGLHRLKGAAVEIN